MNVVDSSGWLEYFADGPNASFFAPAIEEAEVKGILEVHLIPEAWCFDLDFDTATGDPVG